MKRTRKTTFILEEDLLDAVKRKAIEDGHPMAMVVREALREYIAGGKKPVKRKKVVLPSFGDGGWNLPPHVDQNSSSQILGYLDELDMAEGHNPGLL